jgi:HAD superfamily hydrolase (TIGR01509 family)
MEKPLRAIRALIFDFDGLILDTEGPEFLAWSEIYAEHGASLDLESWATAIGTVGGFDPYAELEARIGQPIERERVREWRRARTQALITAEVLRPGVREYLARAKQLGLGTAVASSSPRSWVAGHLERLGVIQEFQYLRCADDVEQVKPDPSLYLAAAGALGVLPEEAIAIEDSPNGVLAANRAGIFCVAVPNPLTSQLPLGHANLRLNALTDLTLDQLLEVVRVRRATDSYC